MSIFPKRVVQGRFVTIHWNFNISNNSDSILFPLVVIGIKRPDGKIEQLFDGHVAALPSRQEVKVTDPVDEGQLQKHTPILVLAEYLSGRHKRERLIDILKGIKTGRHYYFSYTVKDDAPLGKYTILSEIHLDGQVIYSKTADEDFFYVEKIVIEKKTPTENGLTVEVYNPSPETIQVKLVEAASVLAETTIRSKIINLPPKQTTKFDTVTQKALIFYNEEREVIPLAPTENPQLIRNHTLLSIKKIDNGEEQVFVMEKEEEDAYKLEGTYRQIWNKADGVNCLSDIRPQGSGGELNEMLEAGLVDKLRLNARIEWT